MKFILGGPGTGKTQHILKLSSENGIPILCESQARKERLLEKAMNYGYMIPIPIVFSEVKDTDKTVYIDDIEKLLSHMFSCKVEAITINTVTQDDVIKLD